MSRNPNICASCSSMADGMEEATLPKGDELTVIIPEAHGRAFAVPSTPETEQRRVAS